jgi:acyl-coenzyme A synthetase/AMP-(fatty) acid ligase
LTRVEREERMSSFESNGDLLTALLDRSAEPPNHAAAMLYRHCGEGRSGQPAIHFGNETYSYGEVADAAASCTAWLRASGITDGDFVIISMPDCPALAAIYFGVVAVGAAAIILNPSLPTEDAFYIAQLCNARLTICHRESLPRLLPLRFLKGMIEVRAARSSWRDTSEIVESVPVTSDADRSVGGADGPAYGLLTSGSTGQPKLVVHRHRDILYAYRGFALPVLELASDDRTICVAKMSTGYGMGCSLLMSFLAGASTVLVEEPPGPAHADAIERHECTLLFAQPRFLAETLVRSETSRSCRSLRQIMTGGEPLGSGLVERWSRFSDVELLDSYGSTEVGFLFISNRRGRARRGSVGQPVEGVDVEIIDERGEPAKAGRIGTLRVRGPMVIPGYWNDSVRSEPSFRDGWFITNDMFSIDEDGYYSIHGRADHLIKLGCGDWVNPTELEKVILEHDAVDECAVIGAPDEAGLLVLKAVVVTGTGAPGRALATELSDLVGRRWPLQPFKRLGVIEFATGLPKTAAGKLDRSKLSPASMTEFSYRC